MAAVKEKKTTRTKSNSFEYNLTKEQKDEIFNISREITNKMKIELDNALKPLLKKESDPTLVGKMYKALTSFTASVIRSHFR